MTSIVICDPPSPLRRTLAERVAGVPGVRTVRVVDDAEHLLLVLQLQPADVVLLASHMAGPRASGVVQQARTAAPEARVVLLTMGTDPDDVVGGLTAGAVGYLARDAAIAEIAAALSLLPEALPIPPRSVGPPAPGVQLTNREQQVLEGMSQGRSNAQIGEDLFLSEDTIKTHARRLFRKMQVNDRAHAVAEGFRRGLLG